MGKLFAGLTGLLSLARFALSQSCNTSALQTSIPNDGSHVALASYSYCAGTLNATAYVSNDDYNKVVTLFYANAQGNSTPLTSITLNYASSLGDDGSWELWAADTPVWVEGLAELVNLTYEATDIGQTYSQKLNLAVTASGGPAPTLPSPPAPFASPSGFGDDITDFLAVSDRSQAELSLARMFQNINPAVEGAAPGVVVAGQSGPSFAAKDPDYEYTWVRDSSLTMDVVYALYNAATDSTAKQQYEETLFQYAGARAVEQNDPNLQTGLGEPKFYLNDTIFSGPWGRPQNDGPATSAITLIEFANSYLASGGDAQKVQQYIYDSSSYPATAPVQSDLLFVASNWTTPSFDLWEEESSDHFYNKMVQRRALLLGSTFATAMNDSSTASTLSAAADALTATLSQFWDEGRQILLYAYGPVLKDKASYLDVSVILGLIHGYAGDGTYSYTNDRVQATVVRLVASFLEEYPLANKTQHDNSGNVLGVPIGRYPEDVYNGTGTQADGGNPWYLATAALAQFMWTASWEYTAAGCVDVTDTSEPFFTYFAPGASVAAGKSYGADTAAFKQVVDSLNGWGDAFMRTVKFYTPADGHLAEEYNRDTGAPQGCADLTWSYASVLTAAFARAGARGEAAYVEGLANLGFTPNS